MGHNRDYLCRECHMGHLFGFDGRITRLQWWTAQLVCVGLSAFVSVLQGSVLLQLGMLAAGYIYFTASIKRYHDMDKSGWWLLLTPWQILYLGFVPGTSGANTYGPAADPIAFGFSLSGRNDTPEVYDFSNVDSAIAKMKQQVSCKVPTDPVSTVLRAGDTSRTDNAARQKASFGRRTAFARN